MLSLYLMSINFFSFFTKIQSECLTLSAHLADIQSIEENAWVVGKLAPGIKIRQSIK